MWFISFSPIWQIDWFHFSINCKINPLFSIVNPLFRIKLISYQCHSTLHSRLTKLSWRITSKQKQLNPTKSKEFKTIHLMKSIKDFLANLKQEINNQKESKLPLTSNSMILKIVFVRLVNADNINVKFNASNQIFIKQQLTIIHSKTPSIIWKNKKSSCSHQIKYLKKSLIFKQSIKKNTIKNKSMFKNH